MSKSRKIADLLDSNGDVVVEALEHALTDGQQTTLVQRTSSLQTYQVT